MEVKCAIEYFSISCKIHFLLSGLVSVTHLNFNRLLIISS